MEGNALVIIGLPAALFIIMVGMGLSLAVGDFRRVAEQPRGVAIGLALQLLAVPALGFAIGGLAGGGIFAVGLVLVAALPGGTTSNLLCYLAKASLALSITLTVLASLITILTLPLYVNLALTTFMGESEALSMPVTRTLITMLVIVVIPVGIGMSIKAAAPAAASRAEPIISAFSMIVLIAIIIGIVIAEWTNLPAWLAAAWAPVLALNLSALALGLIVGKWTGLSSADGLTLAIEVGIKNTTLGLTVALSLLGSTELALASAVYGLLMYLSVIALTVYGRHLARGTASVAVGAAR
ncbi:MAG: bile acid:sodium symporter [Xanthomonadales bacterium]|nr:bile acid:sodium symporter [Xanthomonadales bacterium]